MSISPIICTINDHLNITGLIELSCCPTDLCEEASIVAKYRPAIASSFEGIVLGDIDIMASITVDGDDHVTRGERTKVIEVFEKIRASVKEKTGYMHLFERRLIVITRTDLSVMCS